MATMATLKNPNRITGSRDHGICDFDGLITVTNIIEITIILKIEIQDVAVDDGDDDNDEEEDEEDEEEEEEEEEEEQEQEQEEEEEEEEEEDHDVDDDNHHRQNLRKVCFFWGNKDILRVSSRASSTREETQASHRQKRVQFVHPSHSSGGKPVVGYVAVDDPHPERCLNRIFHPTCPGVLWPNLVWS